MAIQLKDVMSLATSLNRRLSAMIELNEKKRSCLRERMPAMEPKCQDCQLLLELNRVTNHELRERVTTLNASFLSTFEQAIGVELRLRQMKELEDLATVRGNVDVTEIQATSLNCMHTFCRYCISQWKNSERIRQIEAGCPVCREPATSEKRNYFADNLIDIMVDCYPEEERNSRKQLVANHQELSQMTQEVLGMRHETNSFIQATNHTGQLMRQIAMQIKDIFQFLDEREHHLDALDAILAPRLPDVQLPQPNLLVDIQLPQPNLPVVPVPHQLQRRENAQRDRQSRTAILGIQGPRAIQRASRTNQSSAARRASVRKLGTLFSRPDWRY
uniref:RING-type domain-containing protein n=1 Tax=Daphnia galeata TaxID=27404 RepID=A0A8J2WMM9_9CRUS|nr:unnamed protein product [Daphnia galeata]